MSKEQTDWNILKSFSRNELLEMVPTGFAFKTTPWTHQIAAFLANISNDGFLDALDLGTGKTKVAIDTCRYIDFTNGNKGKIKVLFVCLNSAVEKMQEEVLRHSNLSAICVRGSGDEKWKILDEDSNFYIINYESLRSILSNRVLKGIVEGFDEKTKKITRKKKRKDELDDRLIKRLLKKKFDVLILDESHTIKTPKSLIFKIIKRVSLLINNRTLLTGTPFGNTLLDVWSQYFSVDRGETFGRNFSQFRAAYFEDKGWFGPLWVPTKTGEKYIKSKLFSKAIRYKEDEVDDLPEKVFNELTYTLGSEQRELYNKLVENESHSLLNNISNKSIAFRSIASGFIKSNDGIYVFKDNPKLDLLESIIDSSVESHKIVIFVEYTMTRRMIENLLKNKKIKFNSLSGETKNKYEQYNTFQTNNEYRVMVANIKSGGASIDLTAATYCVFHELGGSLINHQQALKRIHRGGQKERCFFYYLIGNSTIERSMYKNLSDRKNAFDSIIDAKKFIMGEDNFD